MKFLPDSAILGTLGRIKHATNKKRKGRAVSKEEIVLAQSWSSYQQDFRTLEQLLELAKENREKNGKDKEKI
jgi:hypothetical protein